MSDNELIAEWMNPEWRKGTYSWRPGVYDPIKVENLQYDTVWGWIMPVVAKIVEIGLDDKSSDDTVAKAAKFTELSIATPLSGVYSEVVKFIKWHNQHSK